MSLYRFLADFVVIAHAAYVLFVVVGFLLTLAGSLARWQWTRNVWFRCLHLATILVVVVESLLGIVCPLTTLENHFRGLAGESVEAASFMGRLVHNLLFLEAPEWAFTLGYCLFGGAVVLLFLLWPPAIRTSRG